MPRLGSRPCQAGSGIPKVSGRIMSLVTAYDRYVLRHLDSAVGDFGHQYGVLYVFPVSSHVWYHSNVIYIMIIVMPSIPRQLCISDLVAVVHRRKLLNAWYTMLVSSRDQPALSARKRSPSLSSRSSSGAALRSFAGVAPAISCESSTPASSAV